MAKVVLSVRVHAALKLWVEKRAKSLNTNEAWIVEQSIYEQAKGDLPPDFNPSMPERGKK